MIGRSPKIGRKYRSVISAAAAVSSLTKTKPPIANIIMTTKTIFKLLKTILKRDGASGVFLSKVRLFCIMIGDYRKRLLMSSGLIFLNWSTVCGVSDEVSEATENHRIKPPTSVNAAQIVATRLPSVLSEK